MDAPLFVSHEMNQSPQIFEISNRITRYAWIREDGSVIEFLKIYDVKWILSPKVWQPSDSFFWAMHTRQCCQVKQLGVSSKPEKSLVLQDYQPLLF